MMIILHKAWAIFIALLVAFAITAVGQGLWGAMVMANAKLSPAVPWAAVVMPFILFGLVAVLSGRGWPKWGAVARRALVPLAPVSTPVWTWSLVSGVAGIVTLAALWTVMADIVRVPPNLLPDTRGIPPLSLAAFLLVSIVAAPVTEEIAFRGYAMGLLRRQFGPIASLVIASLMFASAHLTQGLSPPKLIVYFTVGLTLGVVALRTGSLLPAMVVHSFGDLVFFTMVWPHDAGRRLISDGGADAAFWTNVAVLAVMSPVWLLTLRQLIKVTSDGAGKD